LKTLFFISIFYLIQAKAIVGSIDLSDADKALIKSHTVVVLNSQNPSTHSRCTGTLVAKNIVLTAAHCIPVSLKDFWIVTSEYEFAVSERHQVTNVKVPDDYKSFNLPFVNQPNNDVALVQFAGALPAAYKPIPWMSSFIPNQDRFWLYVAGYGVSNEELGDTGELRFSKVVIEDALLNAQQSFMKGNQSNGQGICKGDSGGPTYIKFKNDFYVLGVVSAIVGGCTGTSYFNKTVFYDAWIQEEYLKLL
jgi:secreted trypsin-like serine protease